MLIESAVVVALGAPTLRVLVFETLLNATSMFNHGNVYLPAWMNRILRWVWSRWRCIASTTPSYAGCISQDFI
ncbi:MAG: hypothetical protein IRY87_27970 [Acetobacteraceae bacterium]|nr:hypothetical protein [Acetobacteraceae bacterium]